MKTKQIQREHINEEIFAKLVSNFQNSEKNILESQDRDCCESTRCNA